MSQGNANLYQSVDTGENGGELKPGGFGNINIRIGNAGHDTIVANSFEDVITVGPNARIKGFDRKAKGPDGVANSWPEFSLEFRGKGLGNTVVIRNKTGYGPMDLKWVSLKVEASKKKSGTPMIIAAAVSYIHKKNPLLNNQYNAIQGNVSPADDNSTSSFTVQ